MADAPGSAAATRWAILADPEAERAFRDSTRPTERATLRVAAIIVAAVDVVANAANTVTGVQDYTPAYVAVQAAGLAVCAAAWAGLGRVGPARWRAWTLGSSLALIAVIATLVWFGYDMDFRGAILVPAGVLVIYLVMRLDLAALTLCANTYAIGTFFAWLHVAPEATGSQISFLAAITGVAQVAGWVECRRLQYERRTSFSSQDTLTMISRTDDLTGLSNRRCFYQTCDETLPAVADNRAAVLLIDLDRFKEVNDTLGHHTGDILLQTVAGRLRAALPAAAAVARLGGDEFAALLVGGDAADPVGAARRFLTAMDQPVELDGLSVHVRASVGIARRDNGQDRATLLRQADVAMYRAKQTGSGAEVYHPENDRHGRDQLEMAGQLDTALKNGEIVLYYQPKTTITTGVTAAVEALIRWQHPTLGLLTPEKFLPVAETNGMMRTLTLRVIELALTQAAAWRRAGRHIRIAVNLAPANLLDTRFPTDVKHLLDVAGLPASVLQLEITENTIMVDPDRILQVVTTLGDMGFTFALDDYGTGYSSLSYLALLPVDEIKIDRSFVTDLPVNPHNRIIVASTVHMAHQLGFTVIAEGIEDHRTWQHLADLACDTGQGYYLSKPAPAPDIDRWIDHARDRQTADDTTQPRRGCDDDTPPVEPHR